MLGRPQPRPCQRASWKTLPSALSRKGWKQSLSPLVRPDVSARLEMVGRRDESTPDCPSLQLPHKKMRPFATSLQFLHVLEGKFGIRHAMAIDKEQHDLISGCWSFECMLSVPQRQRCRGGWLGCHLWGTMERPSQCFRASQRSGPSRAHTRSCHGGGQLSQMGASCR